MKRTNQTELLIEHANKYLKANSISNPNSEVAFFVMDFLLKNDMYRGFNFYKSIVITHNGVEHHLSKVCSESECEYIQII